MKYSDISDLSVISRLVLSVSDDSRKGAYCQTVYAKQNDRESRYLEVTVKTDRQILEIPEDAVIRIRCTKPDSTSVVNDGCVHNGKAYVEITGQMLSVPGPVKADIGIYADDSVLSTATFIIEVIEAPYDEAKLVSSDEFSALTDALTTVGEISSYQNEVTDVRTAADGMTYATAGDAVRAQCGGLSGRIDKIADTALDSYLDGGRSDGLLGGVVWTPGYILNNGTLADNADFSVSEYINVTAYEQLTLNVSRYATYAFFTADGNRIADTAAYGTIDTASTVAIDVYPGATYFRYACKTEDIGVDTVTTVGGVIYTLSRELANNDGTVVRGINPALSLKLDALSETQNRRITGIPNIKFDVDITFSGKIDSFGGLSITLGSNVYNGAMVKIDDTNVTVYRYTNALNAVSTQAHGLTISDFINVIIKVYTYEASIFITTGSGMFISERVPWYGGRPDLNVYAYPGTNITDCQLSWHSDALKRGIWYFGDSYLDIYPYTFSELSYDNAMFDGFSGRGSADAWTSLTNALQFNNPNVIVWGLGMNNPDTDTAISTTWQTYADKVIELCRERSIELIFLTIPNTPTMNNSFKNEYIKASGCKYIDVADCVGASEAGSGWYSGLLSTDNVHPTTLGGRVIGTYIIIKLPQLRRL